MSITDLRLLLAAFLISVAGAGAQEVSLQTAQALDEWRWGVIAYNDGAPGKALLALERALSLNPTDPSIREWLGRSYWRSGMEDAALALWDALADEGFASTALTHRREQLRRRLLGEEEIPPEDEWIPLAVFPGTENGTRFFEHPSVARSIGDGSGSFLVSSYANGELLRLNANGALVERYEGGVEGFDRPFDILPIAGERAVVSEFQADRLSILSLTGLDRGYRMATWGESGRGQGQFLGPQYLALSPDGLSIYVSDWGNRRVSKWNLDGNHVLTFEAGGGFSGFEGVAGIACEGNRVFVADSLRGVVEVFDPAGNYLGPLIEDGLDSPEGLSIHDGNLFIADGRNVHRVNLNTGVLTLEVSLGSGNHRVTSVFRDDNGNLALCDFSGDSIHLLTPLSTLYGGLDVTLNRVRADAHPNMAVDLTVKDRRNQPITGLDASNFRVFDGEAAILQPEMDWSSSEDDSVSVVAVVDVSEQPGGGIERGVEDLTATLGSGDSFALVKAVEGAVVEELQPGARAGDIAGGSGRTRWDEALRLATVSLVPERRRKAVVAFIAASPHPEDFDRYGLVETARMMANNGVEFHVVYSDESAVSRELNYLAAQSGGGTSQLYRPEGSGAVIDELRRSGVGRYTVRWRTSRSSGFGRSYLPVAVEVVYISKSGRDESGAFAPLR